MQEKLREAIFVGPSQKELGAMPEEVQDAFGYALHLVQAGETPHEAKPMKGVGHGVWELRDDYQTNTYRAVYVVQFESGIYILHCFQKKSKSGIATPRQEIELIRKRLREAEVIHRQRTKS